MAACVTVNVNPAIVMFPVLAALDVFAVTEYPTLLFPAPEAPDVIVIQFAWLEAVQVADVDDDVTATVAVVAADEKLADVGDKENAGPDPACVTDSVSPAIAIEPVRG